MKYILSILVVALMCSTASADFSAHIVRTDTVYPMVTSKIRGDLFHIDMMRGDVLDVGDAVYHGDLPRVAFEAHKGETSESAKPIYKAFFGGSSSIRPESKTNVVINFSVKPEVTSVVFLTDSIRGDIDDVNRAYWISLNAGHWLPYHVSHDWGNPYSGNGMDSGIKKTVTAPIFNLPHDIKNPHVDLRSLGDGERNVAFMASFEEMTRGVLKIVCYDENKKIVPDGVLYSDWQHGVRYVGDDKYHPDGDLQHGYKVVSHDVIDNLTYIFGETTEARVGEAVRVLPGPSEQGRGTRELHIGLVATEPTVVQFAAWSESYDSRLVVLNADRSQVIRPLDRVSEKGRGDDLTVFDIVLRTAGVHKVILAYPGNKKTSDPQDIHLFIRRQGDTHLRPFTAQDSVIVD